MSEKKPREFWIERRACGTFMVWDRKQDGMIHVREVLPEAEPEFPEKEFEDFIESAAARDSEGDYRLKTIAKVAYVYGYDAGRADRDEEVREMREALESAERKFAHIENWHRDHVTPEGFEDCQEVGMTPEEYLRAGKNEIRDTLAKWKGDTSADVQDKTEKTPEGDV